MSIRADLRRSVRLAPAAHPVSEPTGALLRWLAVLLLVAAGVLHLIQVGVHVEEGWYVAGFFVAVGIAQLAGGLWLLQPRRPMWLWIGIVGSAAVVAVWIVSRTSGLPLVEGGEPEPPGIADAFASLVETLTIAALGLHVLATRGALPAAIRAIAAVAALALATAWQLAAGRGAFNADDARLALDRPEFMDWLVVGLGLAVAASFLSTRPGHAGPALAGLRGGLLTAAGLIAAGGVVLTLPPTIGQNLDCAYAPLATVTGTGHAEEPAPVAIPPGEARLISVFELRVCGPDRVELLDAEPLTMIGTTQQIGGFWLLPRGAEIDEAGLTAPPPDALPVPPGGVVQSGQRLAVEVRGIEGDDLQLASVRLTYRTRGGGGAFGFATSVTACTGSDCEGGQQE